MDQTTALSQLTAEHVAYGVMKIVIDPLPIASKCQIAASGWSGSPVSPNVIVEVPDCSIPAVFDKSSFNNVFAYDQDYTFAMSGLDSSGSVVCTGPTLVSTPASPDCSFPIAVSRPDPISIATSINGSIEFGLCRVSLQSYNAYVFDADIVETKPCDLPFVFQSDGRNLTFPTGSTAQFLWEYLPDGVNAVCASALSGLQTITDPTCSQLLRIANTLGDVSYVGIADPQPLQGTCVLLLQSCAQSDPISVPLEIPLPSCSHTAEISLARLQTLVPSIVPGSTCTLSWRYSFGTTVCLSANTIDTPPLRAKCSITQSPAVSGTITLKPAITIQQPSDKCQVALLGCDGIVLDSPVVKQFSFCTEFFEAWFSSADSVLITDGSTCSFQMKQLPLTDSFTTSTAFGCDSGPLTFSASGFPSWSFGDDITVRLSGAGCVDVSWPSVAPSPTAPVLCYRVSRKDGTGPWTIVQDCGMNQLGYRRLTACGLTTGVSVQFKVVAVNANGDSDPLVADTFHIEQLLTAPASTFLSPLSTGPFQSGNFPLIRIQSMLTSTSGPSLDSETVDKLFVAALVRPSTVDVNSTSALVPIDIADDHTPAFVLPLTAEPGHPGQYRSLNEFVPVGEYSLAVSSLEHGGLRGQYWANPFFQGPPSIDKKDSEVDFRWFSGPIVNEPSLGILAYDLVSIRWAGFVEPEFVYEQYTFQVETVGYIRMWINEILVIDYWTTACSGVCACLVEMDAFASIRIDWFMAKGFDQSKSAGVTLKWVSYSQSLQVIPSRRLYKSLFINGNVLPSITVIPDDLSGPSSLVIVPSGAVSAGSPGSIFIQAKDRFGQNLTSSTDSFTCTLSLLPALSTSATYASVVVDATAADGLYEVLFTLTTAGVYQLDIADIGGSPLNTTGLNVTIVAAPAVVPVSASVIDPSPVIAGSRAVVAMQLQDAYGNTVNGSLLSENPVVFISVQWLYDSIGIARLGANFDDSGNRTDWLGSTFISNETVWDSAAEVFYSIIEIRVAGTYSVEVSVVGSGRTPVNLPDWTVIADTAVDPLQAVVVTKLFPPTTLVAGIDYTIEVQLRDRFGNPIDSTPTGLDLSAPVRVSVGSVSGSVCSPKDETFGVYTCTLTPMIAGPTESMSVLVNGVFASYIPDQSSHPRAAVRGSWAVPVSPGAIDGSKSVVMGLRPSYIVSASAEANVTLVLRDAYSNQITDLFGYLPLVVLTFTRDDLTLAGSLMDYTVNSDGSLAVGIYSSVPTPMSTGDPDYTGWIFGMSVETVPVPVTTGTRVRFAPGKVSAVRSPCGALIDIQTVGVPAGVMCVIHDQLDNVIDRSDLYVVNRWAMAATTGHTPVEKVCDYLQGGTYLSMIVPTVAGTYSVSSSIAQPGGLIGQYYANADFTNMLSVGPTPLSDGTTEYTMIDEGLETDWAGAIKVDSVTALSVRWSGLWRPPAALTIRFYVRASGGLRLTMGSAVMIDQLAASAVDTVVDILAVTTDPSVIIVEFVPYGTANLSITWQYPSTSGPGFSIPPSALLAPLLATQAIPSITVNPGILSELSPVFMPGAPMRVNVPDFFIIETRDIYGNLISDQSDCLYSGGVSPGCLFDIALEQPDGTAVPTVSFLGDGQYRVNITLATDVPKSVVIQVITGLNPGDRIPLSGSPFPLPVMALVGSIATTTTTTTTTSTTTTTVTTTTTTTTGVFIPTPPLLIIPTFPTLEPA